MGRSDTAGRVQLGNYWLEYRAERDDWSICWYDAGARTRRRRKTGVRGGGAEPPREAHEALARHYLEANRPAQPQAAAAASVAELLNRWLREHVSKKADAARYAISVQHLLRFFGIEQRLGRVTGGVTVQNVNKALVEAFMEFRKNEGVGGHTISRDLAALRGCLNWAKREELIATAPFIRDVEPCDKAKPRELVYSMEQIAALLEAAWSRTERHHVLRYAMIALSTCGRGEAILDLHDHQIRGGLVYFLDPGRMQTSKRRSIVPIAPTLRPWLDGIKGKIIRYRVPLLETRWADPVTPEWFERDCRDIGKAFEACLLETGISKPVLSPDGEQLVSRPRASWARPLGGRS